MKKNIITELLKISDFPHRIERVRGNLYYYDGFCYRIGKVKRETEKEIGEYKGVYLFKVIS